MSEQVSLPVSHGTDVRNRARDLDRVKGGNGSPADGQVPHCYPISTFAEEVTGRHTYLICPVPPHQHDSYLIAFVLAGSGQHEDASGRLPILPGDVCIVPPGQWHGYPRAHGMLSLFNLTVTRSYLAACAPLLGEIPWLGLLSIGNESSPGDLVPPTHVRLSPVELDCFRPLLLALTDELEDQCASNRPGVRAGLLLQILGLLGFDGRGRMHLTQDEDVPDDVGILAALHYLEARYMGPLSIEEVAGQSGYTPTYLTRKFRQRLGLSPSAYLLHLRMQRACTLLRDTSLSISSIACQVGFRDSQYFATRFHRAMGTTPSAFRAAARRDSQTS